MQVTYGTNTFDFNVLPESTKLAMLKRGVTHFLGNEQASKVTAWKKKTEEGSDEVPGRSPSDDELAAKKAEFVESAIAAMEAGEVGTASRGPAQDPVDSEMERIAKREITGILKSNGAKFEGKGEERKVKLTDGSFTMDELVDRRLANADHGARIRQEAVDAIAASTRQAEKAKQASGSLGADSIG